MKKKLLLSLLLIALSALFVLQIAKQSQKSKETKIQTQQTAQQTVESVHLKNIEIPEGSEEIVEERDTNKLVYQNPDGTFTALFTQEPIHYKAEDGTYQEIDLTYEKNGSTYVSNKNAVKTTVTNNELTVANPDKKAKITWLADSPITVQDNVATYKDKYGNTWKYTNTVSGVKLETTIEKRQGNRTYTFPYKYDGKLTVDPSSGVITGEGFTVPLSFAKGQNGQIIYASHWVINNDSTVSFTIDDSEFPDSAFPYTLDPTTSFNSSTDDGHVMCAYRSGNCNSGTQVVTSGSTMTIGYNYLGVTNPIFEGFISFDTASIDDDAVIYFATLNLYLSSTYDSTRADEIRAAVYNWTSPLTDTEWRSPSQLNALTYVGAVRSGVTSSYNSFIPNGDSLTSNINKTGNTKFILYSGKFADGSYNSPSGNNTYEFNQANSSSNKPVLQVVYAVHPANTMQFEGLKMEGIRAD